jgi:oligoribonuclease
MSGTRHPYQLWIDMETTGLNDRTDVPLEVGLVLSDETFSGVFEERWTIYEPWYEDLPIGGMPDFVAKMHNENGLLEECRNGVSFSLSEVHGFMYEFVKEHGLSSADPLCGSSVQFDRRFCDRYFPTFTSGISYRNIDVSSIKETVERFRPDIIQKRDIQLSPLKLHRVLPDIEDTLAEYQFYVEEFGLV